MSKLKPVSTGPMAEQTYDRMIDIVCAILPGQHSDPRIEYSALICAAALAMAASQGVEPTPANLGRITAIVANKILPVIESEVKRLS